MSYHHWLEKVKMARNMELREICLMAQLAEQLPSPDMSSQVIAKIAEESMEANFWNTLLACYDKHYPPGPCDPYDQKSLK